MDFLAMVVIGAALAIWFTGKLFPPSAPPPEPQPQVNLLVVVNINSRDEPRTIEHEEQ